MHFLPSYRENVEIVKTCTKSSSSTEADRRVAGTYATLLVRRRDAAAATLLGRPPFFPFVRAAVTFALVVARPPLRPIADIHFAVPNTWLSNPGT